ncbi:cytochrome B5 isoform D, ARABIDOPSIS CYTOCHROME B5 ISOFORM D [Hibiscus trionum]|uniref:Cytochrome B5 isoform D, ARABIDOPSIS CYTOCHROME B5 ISOFORM D n=1 Tax=Hibiscus trionum TaxID=183268 RepID=A0A9W7IPU6_HIBTR|nr:cytochrome B5 isoform D, ARABIDOPSIS CYTOCHROME B5 ISOFORM D [Hibiscus trionum]
MGSGEKVFVYEDLVQHKDRDDCWLLISGKVYDVTQFLEEHPGGDEVLLAASGKDATDDFEDIGHSDDARGLMEKYCIGEVDSTTVPLRKTVKPQTSAPATQQQNNDPGLLFKILQFLVPLLILGFAFGLQFLRKEEKTET